jgi:hypothetical protein
MTFRRIRHHVNHDGKETTIDSDKPQGVAPDNLALQLKGLSVKATFRDGKISEVAGVKKLVDKQGKLWSSPERGIQLWSEALKAILLEPLAYLPAKPVAVGETWKVQRTLGDFGGYPLIHTLPYRMHDSTQCKLLRIQESGQGRIAVIHISGETRDPSEISPVFRKSGELRVNIDKEAVLVQRVALDRADEVNPGGGFTNDVTKIVAEMRFPEDTAGSGSGVEDQETKK